MSKTFVSMTTTAGVTLCTRDGTPYRGDINGVVYVLQGHQTEVIGRGMTTATAASLHSAGGHDGHGLTVQGENSP